MIRNPEGCFRLYSSPFHLRLSESFLRSLVSGSRNPQSSKLIRCSRASRSPATSTRHCGLCGFAPEGASTQASLIHGSEQIDSASTGLILHELYSKPYRRRLLLLLVLLVLMQAPILNVNPKSSWLSQNLDKQSGVNSMGDLPTVLARFYMRFLRI